MTRRGGRGIGLLQSVCIGVNEVNDMHMTGVGLKAAFHDTDIDTDSPNTPTSFYVSQARFPLEHYREDVGVVKCGLYTHSHGRRVHARHRISTVSTLTGPRPLAAAVPDVAFAKSKRASPPSGRRQGRVS